jgi:hypothetical protein
MYAHRKPKPATLSSSSTTTINNNTSCYYNYYHNLLFVASQHGVSDSLVESLLALLLPCFSIDATLCTNMFHHSLSSETQTGETQKHLKPQMSTLALTQTIP